MDTSSAFGAEPEQLRELLSLGLEDSSEKAACTTSHSFFVEKPGGQIGRYMLLSVLGEDVSKGKLAASILLTMPGTPYLYYGEEIGMLGMKPDENIREPFLWEAAHKDTFRTKWMTPEYSLDTTVEPLSKQMSDEQSIYQLYKKLIQLRNSSSALALGSFEDAPYGNGNLIAFYRSYEESQLLVIHNVGGKKISMQLKPKDEGFNNNLFSTNDETVKEHKVILEANASIILSR